MVDAVLVDVTVPATVASDSVLVTGTVVGANVGVVVVGATVGAAPTTVAVVVPLVGGAVTHPVVVPVAVAVAGARATVELLTVTGVGPVVVLAGAVKAVFVTTGVPATVLSEVVTPFVTTLVSVIGVTVTRCDWVNEVTVLTKAVVVVVLDPGKVSVCDQASVAFTWPALQPPPPA